MNVMAIDCEYNQPSRKTIEIGAAIYKARTGELIEKFHTYVNPGEPISQYIVELTGVTDKDVANAPNIAEAYEMLRKFHHKHKCFRNPIVWGSGYRNDSQHLHQESGVTDENFMGFRVIDAKSIYQSMQMIANGTVSGGLQTICEKRLGIGFEGRAHGALADAVNTFRVWFHLSKRLDIK